jgi:hypothetical protein
MKIFKLAGVQKVNGSKKFKIVLDFKTGDAKVVWLDNQFGPEGAPCTKMLLEMFKNVQGAKSVGNQGFRDKDTSATIGQEEEILPEQELEQSMLQNEQGG